MVFCNDEYHDHLETIEDIHPDATEIVEVGGGWMVFGNEAEYYTWMSQS